tara:strand:+ start:114 stop:368 length:255 start_codon:yes stop_codon:yes gene_type:complete
MTANIKITSEDKQRILNIVEDVEKLTVQRDNVNSEIKEAFDFAEDVGYDIKAMKEVIKLRKKDPQKAVNEEDMRDFYKDILIKL